MDANLKAKWIEALRSGNYKQTREQLMTPDYIEPAYCCIGVGYVACINRKIDFGDDTYMAADMLGIGDGPIVDELIALNDVDHLSFEAIADYIEAKL